MKITQINFNENKTKANIIINNDFVIRFDSSLSEEERFFVPRMNELDLTELLTLKEQNNANFYITEPQKLAIMLGYKTSIEDLESKIIH